MSCSNQSSIQIAFRWSRLLAVLLALSPFVVAYNVRMEYKPPVKSSVSKFYDRRFSRSNGSGNSPGKDSSRSTSSKSAYAGALSAPSPTPASSFERRMRSLVTGTVQESQKTEQMKAQQRSLLPNVVRADSLAEYKKVVADEQHKIVATRFYAPWCRACKAVAPFFYRLARDFPDVVFVDVPVTEQNTSLHQGLGVPSLPFGHIYHPQGGLVEEHKLTRNLFTDFQEKLRFYRDGQCPLPADFYDGI